MIISQSLNTKNKPNGHRSQKKIHSGKTGEQNTQLVLLSLLCNNYTDFMCGGMNFHKS